MDEQKEFFDEPERVFFNKPSPLSVVQMVWASIKGFFKEKPGIIILSALTLLLVWGYHGNLDILRLVIPSWSAPGEATATRPPILPGVSWDRELISFLGGTILVVLVPWLIIRFGFKESLADYGMGLPPRGSRTMGFMIFLTLVIFSIYPYYGASHDGGMQAVYPFFKSFNGLPDFVSYELCYFFFFLAIEFIFRGYLLFGLANTGFTLRKRDGTVDTYYFGRYAIILSMLSYTAWHLGKPLPELWGTPVWGLLTGASVYAVRSIWPVLMAHWLLNVFIDAMILSNLGHPIF
jgi:hypothetical protein